MHPNYVPFLIVVSSCGVVAAPVFGQGAPLCSDAQLISGDGVFAFDNSAATNDADVGCPMDAQVWFKWTATQTGTATLDTVGQTSIDTVVAVFTRELTCSKTPNIDNLLACNDDT